MISIPTKEAPINIRVTPARKAMYREQAAAEGMRLSEWLRRLADQRLAEVASRERSVGRV